MKIQNIGKEEFNLFTSSVKIILNPILCSQWKRGEAQVSYLLVLLYFTVIYLIRLSNFCIQNFYQNLITVKLLSCSALPSYDVSNRCRQTLGINSKKLYCLSSTLISVNSTQCSRQQEIRTRISDTNYWKTCVCHFVNAANVSKVLLTIRVLGNFGRKNQISKFLLPPVKSLILDALMDAYKPVLCISRFVYTCF